MKNKLNSSFLIYKKYHNRLTHIKELAKQKYYGDLIKQTKHNSGLMWKTINDIIKYKKKCSSLPLQKKYNDELINAPSAISIDNAFNEYFKNIPFLLAVNILEPSKNVNFSPTNLIQGPPNSYFLQTITVDEVLAHLTNLNSSKSTGVEGIPIKFITMSSTIIAPILTNLYNDCIVQATFPKSIKIAEVIQATFPKILKIAEVIHKSGSKSDCSYYRPISLLSPFSKIFVKHLHGQIFNYFEKATICLAIINLTSLLQEKYVNRTSCITNF